MEAPASAGAGRESSIAALERLATRHWRPDEVFELGGWLLRAHHGNTSRANSALALGLVPTMAARLATVRSWYPQRGLSPLLSVPVPLDCPAAMSGPDHLPAGVRSAAPRADHFRDGVEQTALRAKLERAGWWPGGPTGAYAFTADAHRVVAHHPGRRLAAGLRVHRHTSPDRAWCARYLDGQVPDAVRDLLVSASDQVLASVRTPDGEAAAIARCSLSDGWAGLTAIEVHPDHRGTALARLLIAESVGWAIERGAHSVFLHTATDNEPAQYLYRSMGFAVRYRYDYLIDGSGRPVQSARSGAELLGDGATLGSGFGPQITESSAS